MQEKFEKTVSLRMPKSKAKFKLGLKGTPNVISKPDLKTKANISKSSTEINLEGSRFRWLNECLYTEESSKSFDLFQKQPELFQAYHIGFRSQVKAWPLTPVEECCIFILNELKAGSAIGDFGCGDAKLAQNLKDKMIVHSFDLVSVHPLVTACNIAQVPLEPKVLDMAVFSLSLMGTDWPRFIEEAQRCLKVGGILYIAEVQSRIADFGKFVDGFKSSFAVLKQENVKEKYFVKVLLKKTSDRPLKLDPNLLKPCLYKRR
jgi:ribosomal RNA-processing protein 8